MGIGRRRGTLALILTLVISALLAATPTLAYASQPTTWGTCEWEIDSSQVLTVSAGMGDNNSKPWANNADITGVKFEEGVILPADCGGLFKNCSSLKSVDLSGCDTSSVTNMAGMFENCSSLDSLDLTSFDTSSVENMSKMFYGCSKLVFENSNLSDLDTTNVTNMSQMFHSCSALTSLDLSGWDTSNVTDMSKMFNYCPALGYLNISGWDTSKVESSGMSGMFVGCASLTDFMVGGEGFDVSGDKGWAFPQSPNPDGWWTEAGDWWLTCDEATARLGETDLYTSYKNSVGDISHAKVVVADQTYSGKALTPAPKVTFGSKVLTTGTDYELAYANNTNAGKATVTVTGKGDYKGTVTATFKILPKAQTISAADKKVAMGKTVKLGAKVTEGGGALTYKSSNAKVAKVSSKGVVTPIEAGEATITVTAAATSNYKKASKNVTVTVTKGKQPMIAKAKAAIVGGSKLAKAKQTLKVDKVLNVKNAQGTLSYKKVSGSKKLTVNKRTGAVTVAKGTKKGTYKVKVKVTAAGNSNWKRGSKTVKFKVTVK